MKKYFWPFSILFYGFPFIVSIVLYLVFEENRENLSTPIGSFLFAGIMLIEVRFAFRPIKRGVNTVKGLFQTLKKPQIYRNICFALFLLFLLMGFSELVGCIKSLVS